MRFSVLPCILLWAGLSFGAVPHQSFTRTTTPSSTVSGTPNPTQNMFESPAAKLPGAFPFRNGTIACRAASPDVKKYKQGDGYYWMKNYRVESLLDFTCQYPAREDLDGRDHYETPSTYTVRLGTDEKSRSDYKLEMGWYNKPGCAHYKKDLGDVEKCKNLWMPYVKKCDSEITGDYTNLGGSYEDKCLKFKFWAEPNKK